MKSFDEWRNAQRTQVNGYTERDAFEAGQQSKQAEVDELQKRIDEALRFYNDAKLPNNIGVMQMAIYLKGNKDEN